MKRRALQLSVVLALVVGCGGSSGSDPADVVEAFLTAYANGDGEAACALLTAEERTAVEAAATGGCAAVVERLTQAFLTDELRERLKEADVRTTSQEGDRAVVTATSDGTTAEVELRRVGGSWRIASAPRFTGDSG